ncbi:sigma-E factor negative regulatory protein [Rheinheimera sp. EpRS3]|uniref:sigma-E factor negative regulatory protein n=1 Tax=Rheinheimera sp. EpRS3 TaxID=1712383 RepID=UPI0007471AA6|nr:RseA family anti-sigma factor [Rheinheimera sp. EpRS3]KUM53008.1 anti-anti-sigma factor [Rheinheimera sp. EpRS3]
MSSENQDWLSAASDNQPLSKAQLDSLLNDAQLQHQFERYHLIGAVLRREPQSPITADFADNFAAQLADEPVYQLQSDRNLLKRLRNTVSVAANGRWLQPVAQGAVAAGVALMAVFGVQQYQQSPQQDAFAPLPVLQTQPIAGFATPVSLSQTTVNDRFAEQEQQAMLEQQKRLQALLNAHRQQVRVMEHSQQANHNSNKADGKDQNEQQ